MISNFEETPTFSVNLTKQRRLSELHPAARNIFLGGCLYGYSQVSIAFGAEADYLYAAPGANSSSNRLGNTGSQ